MNDYQRHNLKKAIAYGDCSSDRGYYFSHIAAYYLNKYKPEIVFN